MQLTRRSAPSPPLLFVRSVMHIGNCAVSGVSSLVEVVGNRFVPVGFYVSHVFFEAGVKGASSFGLLFEST